MIPLKDDTPRSTTPLVNGFIIAANVAVFLFELSLGVRSQKQFVQAFGLVPARLSGVLQGALSHAHVHGHLATASPVLAFVPVVTSMFMHGGWLHLIFNMWFLWIFGRNVEDALGHFPYLVFYLTCGFAAAMSQILMDLNSLVPMVGASGAIAGVMGGYFVLYPRARVLMLVPFLFVFFLWLPAWVVLGYWFALQFLGGVGAALVGADSSSGGVAVWAHVGGFVAGLLLVRLFPSRTMRYRYGD